MRCWCVRVFGLLQQIPRRVGTAPASHAAPSPLRADALAEPLIGWWRGQKRVRLARAGLIQAAVNGGRGRIDVAKQNERKVVRRRYYFYRVKAGLGAVVGTVSAGWHTETLTAV